MGGEQEKMLRVNVAAQRLGLSPRWVRELVRRGDLAAIRRGERQTRIRESSVEAFREERSENS